jgi:hypothetical protein
VGSRRIRCRSFAGDCRPPPLVSRRKRRKARLARSDGGLHVVIRVRVCATRISTTRTSTTFADVATWLPSHPVEGRIKRSRSNADRCGIHLRIGVQDRLVIRTSSVLSGFQRSRAAGSKHLKVRGAQLTRSRRSRKVIRPVEGATL